MKTFKKKKRKNATGQGNDYKTGCLLDYNYFKKNQQAFDADPKTIQQINFAGNLDRAEGETIFSIIEEAEKTFPDFSQETVRVLLIYFALM